MNEIENGMLAVDAVTGFEGRVMAICGYWTGCDQVLLMPRCGSDGKKPDGEWFDMERAAAVEGPALALPNSPRRLAMGKNGGPMLDREPPKR